MLERALFLRQQADLIKAQQKLRESADLVFQPGKRSRAVELIAEAGLAISTSENKEQQGQAKLRELSENGFMDIPLDDFANRLRERPPVAGEGAIARVISEASLREDGEAVAASELGTDALRRGDRQGYREAQQLADEHILKAETIAEKGRRVVQELGDIPLEDLIQDIAPLTPQTQGNRSSRTSGGQERGQTLKRGERMLKTIKAAMGFDLDPQEIAPTFDDLAYQIWEDMSDRYPTREKLLKSFKGTTTKDIRHVIEVLRNEDSLNSAHIDSGMRDELIKVREDARYRSLSDQEKLKLCLREEGWEAIRAKMLGEEIDTQPEQNYDFMDTPIAKVMHDIRESFKEGQPLNVNIDGLPNRLPEFNKLFERIWICALMPAENSMGYFRPEKEEVVRHVFFKELANNPDATAYNNYSGRYDLEVSKIVKLMENALKYYALGQTVHHKLEDRFVRLHEDPDYQYLNWLSPTELGQAMRREIVHPTVIRLLAERRNSIIDPELADAYLRQVTGE